MKEKETKTIINGKRMAKSANYNQTTTASEDEMQALLKPKASAVERERGFRLLLNTYGEMLYWHIRRIVVSHDDAEDAMQETAIKIFSRLDSFEGKSSLKTWAYSIATNEALQLLRKKCAFLQSIDSEEFGIKLIDELESTEGVDAQAAETVFQEALLKLPSLQRLVFNMRYYDDMPYEEISTVTGKNVNTLKTSYHFAAQKIKDYLKENAI